MPPTPPSPLLGSKKRIRRVSPGDRVVGLCGLQFVKYSLNGSQIKVRVGVPGRRVRTKFTPTATLPVELIKSNDREGLPPKTVPWKFGSFALMSFVEQQPPCSLATGSTESAIATEDESPSKIRITIQREKFINNPLATTPLSGKCFCVPCNLATKANHSRERYRICLQQFRKTDKESLFVGVQIFSE
jgi:hypothetical protein